MWSPKGHYIQKEATKEYQLNLLDRMKATLKGYVCEWVFVIALGLQMCKSSPSFIGLQYLREFVHTMVHIERST